MPNKEICIISLNCRGVPVRPEQASKLWDTLYPPGPETTPPDLVVVGVQEAPAEKTIVKGVKDWRKLVDKYDSRAFQERPSEKIRNSWDNSQLLGHQIARLLGYRVVSDQMIPDEGSKKTCYQHLAVLKNPSSASTIHFHTLSVLGKSDPKIKDALKAVVMFYGKTLSFQLSHLKALKALKAKANPRSFEAYSEEIREHLCFMAGLKAKSHSYNCYEEVSRRLKHKFDVCFLFGDLCIPNPPRELRRSSLPPPFFDRSRTFCLCAELSDDELVDPERWGWTFPNFTNDAWPTCGRFYGGRAEEELVSRLVAAESREARDLFSSVYDMGNYGWPDRIGYFCDERKRHIVELISFVDIPKIVVGDHVAIAAKYNIKIY